MVGSLIRPIRSDRGLRFCRAPEVGGVRPQQGIDQLSDELFVVKIVTEVLADQDVHQLDHRGPVVLLLQDTAAFPVRRFEELIPTAAPGHGDIRPSTL